MVAQQAKGIGLSDKFDVVGLQPQKGLAIPLFPRQRCSVDAAIVEMIVPIMPERSWIGFAGIMADLVA